MKKRMVPNRNFYIDPSKLKKRPAQQTMVYEEPLYIKLVKDPAAIEIMNQVLETDYFKGILSGRLDPNDYGGLAVEDGYYCFKGADDYAASAAGCEDDTLRDFLTQKGVSYNEYNETYHTDWHIRDAYGVLPDDPIKNYADYEAYVSGSLPSIYTLVVMLPCEYLWWWLADQLIQKGITSENLYYFWVEWNYNATGPTGAMQMGEYLEAYRNNIEDDKALDIYLEALNYELSIFQNATE